MTRTEQFRLFFDHSKRSIETNLTPYETTVKQILHFHERISGKTDAELKEMAGTLRQRSLAAVSPDDLLVPVFALVREACIRRLGLAPYDVQLMAGVALHHSKLVEMQTGEGKTMAAVFPACLNALTGSGVHILTFNDYLARRDAQWMGPVYDFLGLTTGFIQAAMPAEEKRAAYRCDVTYATAKEAGFDYLRDTIAYHPSEIVQRPLNYAIVDEADALLIDEARNPLILAGNLIRPELDFAMIARFVKELAPNEDYEIDAEGRVIYLTETGVGRAEERFAAGNLHAEDQVDLLSAINLALQAKHFLQRDVDYVVKEGQIKLVDEFTGRIVGDRRWKDGLQTAVEAKEGLKIQSEGVMLNSIAFQHLVQKYRKFAAMTATARSAVEEFYDFYRLRTVVIPPNKTCRRIDHPDLIFSSAAAKKKALIEAVEKIHRTGQPILIGTLTVRESEELARTLRHNKIECRVLNARNDEQEAAVIAEAGRLGAVTISTNMAGRGADIRLGGADETDRERVIQLGGLFVIGTNRHESQRIDRQLRGRAGRQGDPGATRFFISFEDELMIKYKLLEILPKRFRKPAGEEPVDSPTVARFIAVVQGMIEGRLYDRRKALYEYASLIELQRILIGEERQKWLLDDSLLENELAGVCGGPISPPSCKEQFRQIALFQFDRHWSLHLENLSRVKEGIQLVRLGGQHPLRAFRKEADESFERLLDDIRAAVKAGFQSALSDPRSSLADQGMEKPTSTWTYVVNEDPFGNQLSLMLMDNANIGFQVDFLSAILLFISGFFRKKKR